MNKYLPALLSVLILSGCSPLNKVAWVFSSSPIKNNQVSIDRGKIVYENNCQSCHGAKARGNGPLANQFSTKPADLVEVAENRWDSTFAAHVAYGKTGNADMPAFVKTLTEKEIWDVTHYVYSLRG